MFLAFSLDMNENYTIKISGANDKVNATITGGSFFGVRHGLETLSQLILYDDIRDHLLVRYILGQWLIVHFIYLIR